METPKSALAGVALAVAQTRTVSCHRTGSALLALLFAACPFVTAQAQTAPAATSPEAAPPAAASPVPAADTPTAAPTPASPAPKAAPDTQASGGSLQEIVVTATRRSELVSKVPISVSAFSQEALDIKGAKDFNDIAKFTPGVTIDTNGTNSISIRGISSSGGAGTTGIYIDDTPIQMRALGFNADDALPKAFDVERVEVLRGPQGTLFGAGAEGGAVRYIMAQPKLGKTDVYTRNEVSFTQGGAPSYETGLAYGTPLIENELAIRGSIWFRHDGGYIATVDPFNFNTLESNANHTDTLALRLAAKWKANDSVTISPSVLYQDRKSHANSTYYTALSTPSSDTYRSALPDSHVQPDRYFLPALKVEAELGDITFVSNTSYFNRSEISGYDGTSYNLSYFQTFNNPSIGPGSYYPMVNPNYYPLIDGSGIHLPDSLHGYRSPAKVTNKQETFAQEFRLQSDDPSAAFTWTAGLFYSVNKQTSIEEINDPQIANFFQTIFGVDYQTVFTDANGNGIPLLANGDDYYNYNFSQDKQVAAFGEGTIALTDKLKLTLGLRYAKTDVAFNHLSTGPQNFGTNVGTGAESEKPTTPKVSAAYQATKDDLFYLTYAKGYRIGGANAPIPVAACLADLNNLGLSGPPDTYKSDTVNSFELGAKNRVSDSLRIASSLYYIKWKGIQQNVYLPGCGFQFTSNFGDAVAKGGDIQVEYAATKSLSFDLAMGYTSAKYVSDAGTATALIAASGDAIQGASGTPSPSFTAALGTQYDFLALEHKSFIRLDYEYSGRTSTPTAAQDPRTGSYDPLAYTPASTNFFSLRAGTSINKWAVSGFIDNLFDSHPQFPPSSYPHSDIDPYNANPPSSLIQAYTFRPRTIGITAAYRL